MSSVVIAGDTSGTITLAAPAVSGTTTLTLPATTDTLVGKTTTDTLTNKTLTSPTITGASVSSMASSVITSGTAVASTSGTSIDFTSIPSWVKRITVMYSGVSTSGTSNFLVQIGSGSITNTGYTGQANSGAGLSTSTAGWIVCNNITAAAANTGAITILLFGSNTYIESGIVGANAASNSNCVSEGAVTLSGALDRVRITTVNGTDAFDAGSINILYE
jgi:hypothetical protein